ncbi:MAG: recombinase family protein [Pseudomonadaceae bacterium]|nr:recombinase family protein [Pseudomonadaceae bacterium]
MFLRAYLRASTSEQNAERAKESLIAFDADHGKKIASFYVENESGATLTRPELMRLISDAGEGDVILVEQIDRLARLKQADWETLKFMLAKKKLMIVSPELPTSWIALKSSDGTEFTASILQAVNGMLLDMLAAVARKDYEDRRRRQMQGIKKAQAEGKFVGRKPDLKKRASIASLLESGHSYSSIQELLGCSRHLIADVKKESLIKSATPQR